MAQKHAAPDGNAFQRGRVPNKRQELQNEAMQIKSLIAVAMGYERPQDDDNLLMVLTIASDHAKRLNAALDSNNASELEGGK